MTSRDDAIATVLRAAQDGFDDLDPTAIRVAATYVIEAAIASGHLIEADRLEPYALTVGEDRSEPVYYRLLPPAGDRQ